MGWANLQVEFLQGMQYFSQSCWLEWKGVAGAVEPCGTMSKLRNGDCTQWSNKGKGAWRVNIREQHASSAGTCFWTLVEAIITQVCYLQVTPILTYTWVMITGDEDKAVGQYSSFLGWTVCRRWHQDLWATRNQCDEVEPCRCPSLCSSFRPQSPGIFVILVTE